MNQSWKLAPSDLTFLWDECPRCFYLKVVHNFNRPAAPFPKIFSRIDRLMKDHFGGRSTGELSPNLPPGAIRFADLRVASEPIWLPDHPQSCYLKGVADSLIAFSDGSYGIVDFKTSEARPEHVAFYSRQLHAYAYALEHPAPGATGLQPIQRLGLFTVEPIYLEQTAQGQIAYVGNVTWSEIPKDETGFLTFLERIMQVLENPLPPDGNPECKFCQYREAARRGDF
jgi:hypothetical protein